MIDERELLEAAAARYTLEPGFVERIYRRRDRQHRQQRITALVIGLAIAIAAVGMAIRIIERGQRPKPLGPRISAENVAYLTQSWTAPLTGGWGQTPHVSVADGNVYVVDRAAKQLLAFAEDCGEATCSPMWTARIDGDVHAGPVVDDGMVFLVSGQDVVAFETGCGSGGARCTPVWRGPVVGDTGPGVSLAVADGIVWVSTESDPPGPIIAYRADCGRGGSTCAPWWSSDRLSSPLVADGRLYVKDGDRMEAFPTDCEPLTEGCDPVWTWQLPRGEGWIASATEGVVVAEDMSQLYALPTDCRSSCMPRWHVRGDLLGVSEADGLVYVLTDGKIEAYCLDCTAPVFRASLPVSGWGAVGAGGAVLTGGDVAGLVPSDCGEACQVTMVNTGLFGWSDALAVTGGVAFVASSTPRDGVLLAYDLSCSPPCAPVWAWESDSMRHGIQAPVFDGTSMFLVETAEDTSTLRAFQIGTTPQTGVPSTWAAERNGTVEHPDEGGIVAMSDAQRLPGTWDWDLDTGSLGWEEIRATGGRADLWLKEIDETTRALKGGPLAYLGQVDFDSISPDDFGSFTWTNDPIRGTDDERNQLVPGAVFLVVTTEGNYSKVQVLPDDGYDLWLRWVTYEPDPTRWGSVNPEPGGGSMSPALIALLLAALGIAGVAAWVVEARRGRHAEAPTPRWRPAPADHRAGP